MNTAKIASKVGLLYTLSSPGECYEFAWSPDGRVLAAGCRDKIVRLWTTGPGASPREFTGHGAKVYSVTWSTDGTLLASSSADGTIRIWDWLAGKTMRVLKGHRQRVMSVAFAPAKRGALLASTSDDETVVIWDSRTGQRLATLSGHQERVFSVAWAPDASRIATASADATVRLWNLSRTLKAPTGKNVEPGVVLSGHREDRSHDNGVSSVAWSADGSYIASGAADRVVRVWKAEMRETWVVPGRHRGIVHCVRFSPDSRLLASKSSDDIVRLWRTDTWQQVCQWEEVMPSLRMGGLAFHPFFPMLATRGEDERNIHVWWLNYEALMPADAALTVDPSHHADGPRVIQSGYPFDVFLSHRSTDKPLVRRIADDLKRQGVRVWLDEDEILAGQDFIDAMERGIRGCRAAIVFLGAEGRGAWQKPEIQLCQVEASLREFPIIPVILENVTGDPAIPYFLQRFHLVDFRRKEPDPLQLLLRGVKEQAS